VHRVEARLVRAADPAVDGHDRLRERVHHARAFQVGGHGALDPVQDRRDLVEERDDPTVEPPQRGGEASIGRIGHALLPSSVPRELAGSGSGGPAFRRRGSAAT
jgi:hypothetical protein